MIQDFRPEVAIIDLENLPDQGLGVPGLSWPDLDGSVYGCSCQGLVHALVSPDSKPSWKMVSPPSG